MLELVVPWQQFLHFLIKILYLSFLHIFLYHHICPNIFANVFFRLFDRWGQDDRQPVRAGGRDDLPGEPLISALFVFKVRINLNLLTYKTSIQINMTDNLSVRMQHASMGFKNARWAVPSGYPNPTRYPVFLSIPDPTRFSFRNHRVAGNPKHRVLPDISGKPEVSGTTRYSGYRP